MSDVPRYAGTLHLASGFYRILQGMTEDEIIDDLQRMYRAAGGLSMYEERHIRELIRATGPASVAGAALDKPKPEATPENVRAERERRQLAGEPSGYGALAEYFIVGETTIRRRLGINRKSGWK